MSGAEVLTPEELETELLSLPENDVREALDSHLKISVRELDAAYNEKPGSRYRKKIAVGRMAVFSFAKSKFEEDENVASIYPAWQERAQDVILGYIAESPQERRHLLGTEFFTGYNEHILWLNRIVGVGIESRVRCLPASDKALAIEIAIDPVGTFDPNRIIIGRN